MVNDRLKMGVSSLRTFLLTSKQRLIDFSDRNVIHRRQGGAVGQRMSRRSQCTRIWSIQDQESAITLPNIQDQESAITLPNIQVQESVITLPNIQVQESVSCLHYCSMHSYILRTLLNRFY